MGVPGSNILDQALTVISAQTIIYYAFVGNTINSVGQDVTQYAAPVTLLGSFQPVPRSLYQQYGLDFTKDYYTFYTSNDVLDVNRDSSGDQIVFEGQRYQVESNNDWFAIDGWKGCLVIRIGLDSGNVAVWGFNQVPSVNDYVNFGYGNFLPVEN
jgi:hypothetical protein